MEQLRFSQHLVSAGGRLLFRINNITIEGNCVNVLLGDNGVGKTTFFKALCGLNASLSSHENVLSEHNWKPAYVGTQRPMVEYLSVLDYLGFGFSQFKVACIENELNFFNVKHLLNEQIGSLSDGEFRKVAILRQLVGKPSAMFLDEPSAFLDLTNKKKLGEFLKSISGNRLIMISTHDLHFAKTYGDHYYRIANGVLSKIELADLE